MSGHEDLDAASLVAGWYVDFYLADFISVGDQNLFGATGLDYDFVGPTLGIVESLLEWACSACFIVGWLDEHSLFAPLLMGWLDEYAFGAGLVLSGNPTAGIGSAKGLSQVDAESEAMVGSPGRLFAAGSSRSGLA